MATNTPSGTPVPTLGDAPNVPADMLRLATYLDPVTIPKFTSVSNANTALGLKVPGQQANIAGIPSTWNGTAWVRNASQIVASDVISFAVNQSVGGATSFLIASPDIVLPAPAGLVIITASWTYTSAGSTIVGLVVGFDNVYLANGTTGIQVNTAGARDQSPTIQVAIADRAAGAHSLCFLGLNVTAGTSVDWTSAIYSWVALT